MFSSNSFTCGRLEKFAERVPFFLPVPCFLPVQEGPSCASSFPSPPDPSFFSSDASSSSGSSGLPWRHDLRISSAFSVLRPKTSFVLSVDFAVRRSFSSFRKRFSDSSPRTVSCIWLNWSDISVIPRDVSSRRICAARSSPMRRQAVSMSSSRLFVCSSSRNRISSAVTAAPSLTARSVLCRALVRTEHLYFVDDPLEPAVLFP